MKGRVDFISGALSLNTVSAVSYTLPQKLSRGGMAQCQDVSSYNALWKVNNLTDIGMSIKPYKTNVSAAESVCKCLQTLMHRLVFLKFSEEMELQKTVQNKNILLISKDEKHSCRIRNTR